MLKFTPKRQEKAMKVMPGSFLLNLHNNHVYYCARSDDSTMYDLLNLASGGRWDKPHPMKELIDNLDSRDWRVLEDVELREL